MRFTEIVGRSCDVKYKKDGIQGSCKSLMFSATAFAYARFASGVMCLQLHLFLGSFSCYVDWRGEIRLWGFRLGMGVNEGFLFFHSS